MILQDGSDLALVPNHLLSMYQLGLWAATLGVHQLQLIQQEDLDLAMGSTANLLRLLIMLLDQDDGIHSLSISKSLASTVPQRFPIGTSLKDSMKRLIQTMANMGFMNQHLILEQTMAAHSVVLTTHPWAPPFVEQTNRLTHGSLTLRMSKQIG